jgi:hypothetical protein
MQEGRRQKAEGRRQERLYSKLFNLFQLDSYLCQPGLNGRLEIGVWEKPFLKIDAIIKELENFINT